MSHARTDLHPSRALLAALALLLASRGGAAHARPASGAGDGDGVRAPRIVVCFEPPGSPPLSAESLQVALSLQLEPHGFRVRRARWNGAAPRRYDAKLARALAERGASFGVGYQLEAGEISLWIAESAQRRLRRFAMGEPTPGLERSVAASIRTYVLAPAPSRAERPDRGADARAAAGESATTTLRRGARLGAPTRVLLGADYRVDAYPQTSDLRHGPDLWVSVRLWRQLEGLVSVGFRTTAAANVTPVSGARLEASRQFLHFAVGARWVFHPSRWLDLDAGAALRVGVGGAANRSIDFSDSGTLAELMLGAQLGARFRLGGRFAIVARGHVGALIIGSKLTLDNLEAARAEGLELGASLGLHIGLL